jgi:hypothetical protein
MFLLGVPLLIFSFAIYNIVEFVLPGFSWSMEVLRFQLPSGADCAITAGDAMVAGSILLLILEMLKAARMSRRGFMDHLLSMMLFAAMVSEFLLVKQVATSTFLLLLVISFVDVMGGFALGHRAARRDASYSESDHFHSV